MELLIVGILGAILVTMTANVWRWYARTANAMQVQTALDRELKMAAQAIAADYGPALSVRTTDGTDVEFDYDTDGNGAAQWSSPDTVVQYTITADNMLMRHDLAAGTQVPMASNISAFTTEVVSGELNVHLTASYRTTSQDLTLQLRDPS
jgi:hypothetical protein